MNVLAQESSMPGGPSLHVLRAKIGNLCHVVRGMAVAYLIWQFIDMVQFWADGDRVTAIYSRILKTSLPAVPGLQRLEAFALQMVVWLVLLCTVVSIWKLFSGFLRGSIFTLSASTQLQRVGLFGAGTVALGIATAPLLSLILSAHLPAKITLHTSHYLHPEYLLHLTFCLMVVALAHVFKTAAELAEDNEGFI